MFLCNGLQQESGSTGRQQEQRQSPQETGTCVCVCVWVGRCVVCVYIRGGWVDVWVWVFVWVNGWLCVWWVGVWRWGGGQCGVCRGCLCQGEYFWKGMQMLILKSFRLVTLLVTLWTFTEVYSLVCLSMYAMWRVH